MKKHIILIAMLVASGVAYSQVGVNTETPKTTMDISAKRDGAGVITDNTQTYGLQAPRLTRAELTANTATYGTDQRGALVYITDISGGNTTGQRANITATGYYYFDGGFWQKVSNGAIPTGVDITDDAFINDATNTMVKLGTRSTGAARAANTDFVITDAGRVGIGTSTFPTGTSKMDIVGGSSTSTSTIVRLINHNNNSGGASMLNLYNSAGTIASPENLRFDDFVFNINGYSRVNGTPVSSSSIFSKYKGDGTTNLADLRFATRRTTSKTGTSSTYDMILDENGNLGIGGADTGATNIVPTAKLHVQAPSGTVGFRLEDTTQGAGKVLTSDANGNASWQTAVTGGTYTASSGLTMTSNDVKLGGNLGANTAINGNGFTLTFNTTTAGGNKFVSNGTSGSPKSAIQIQDGSQGAGKILTSDANGNAVWAAPTDRVLNVTAELTTDYTLGATDDIVLLNNSNAINLTLPTTGVTVGRKVYVSNINSGVTNYKPDGVIRNGSYNNLQSGTSAILVFIGAGKWEVISGY